MFSLVFPGFYAFDRERKSLINLEVLLGENRTTKERKDRAIKTINERKGHINIWHISICSITLVEAQQRYFSYRAILVAIVSLNSLVLVFMGYRTIIARYVAKWGYRTDVSV